MEVDGHNDFSSSDNSCSGGYKVELFDKSFDLEKYKCAICDKILRDPVQIPQTSNPRRACQKCYTSKISNGICPIFKTHDTTHYRDRFAEREIQELKVICPNKENGCTWSDRLRLLGVHLKDCEYRLILCNYCRNEVVLCGHENSCPAMLMTCRACGMKILRKDIQEHNNYCQMASQVCECGVPFPPSELPAKIMEHYLHQTKCIYTYIGCDGRNPHCNQEKHVAIVVSETVRLKQTVAQLKQEANEKDFINKQLQEQVNDLTEKNNLLANNVDGLIQKMKAMSEEFEKLKMNMESVKNQPQMPMVGGGAKLRKEVEELRTKVNNIQSKEVINKSIADMDLKFQLQENKTMNGVLVWKIDKIDFRMAQAKNGKMVALHSAPCYTKQYQYKYCTRLYLNGDGMGRNTHVSIFFVVMKSEYDDLLKWPMHKRITFELINHENENYNVVESFVSNLQSSSFQKPTNNMNVAAGCPMFIPIEDFATSRFIKQNCAYIKTTVTDVN